MAANVPLGMRSLLTEYASAHRTRGNELCHFIGVPSIIAGAARLLWAVPLFTLGAHPVTLTHAVVLAVCAFYVFAARLLGLVTALALCALAALGSLLPLWLGLTVFLLGWAVQFVGHARYERRSPAFFRNLVHLLVGPAWLVERALFR